MRPINMDFLQSYQWNPSIRYRSHLFYHSHSYLSQFLQPLFFSISFTFGYFLRFPRSSFSTVFNFFCCIFVFSPFWSCNLDRSSDSTSLLFKSIPIWRVWFFYCYYFAEHFDVVESFEIQSSNIRNDVIRTKYCMKQGVNQSNIKTVLDEAENVGRKVFSQSNFHRTWFYFIKHKFFFFCHFWVLLNRCNISSNRAFLLCWMKCWIGLTRPLEAED